jgi:TolB-like protein
VMDEAIRPRAARRSIRTSSFRVVLGALLGAAALLPGNAGAGQVVTKADHEWARAAVAREKAIEGHPAGNTVGVLYFRNRTARPRLDPLQKGLAQMLITDLSQVPGLQVVERIRVQALVEELGLGTSGLVDPETAPRTGKLLGAKWLVGGDLAKGDRNPLLLRGNVLDVPSAGITARPAAEGDLDAIFRLEKELAFGIIDALRIEVSPALREAIAKPPTTSLAALLDFSRGIDESDRGEYGKAAASYRAALTEDPGMSMASEGLKELETRGLIPPGPGRPPLRPLVEELRENTSVTGTIAPPAPLRRTLTPAGVIESYGGRTGSDFFGAAGGPLP